MSYQVTSAIIGFIIASIILWLIRVDHLHSRHAVWWFLIAFGVVVLGIFPQLLDNTARLLGVHYPPTLLFILGFGMILIKVLSIDIHQSALERKVRRLAQRLAILEGDSRNEQN